MTDRWQAICCVQSAIVYFQVSKGFGKAENLIDKNEIGSIGKVGAILRSTGLDYENSADGCRLVMPPTCSISSVFPYPNAPWRTCFCVYRRVVGIAWLLGPPCVDQQCGQSCRYFSSVSSAHLAILGLMPPFNARTWYARLSAFI